MVHVMLEMLNLVYSYLNGKQVIKLGQMWSVCGDWNLFSAMESHLHWSGD